MDGAPPVHAYADVTTHVKLSNRTLDLVVRDPTYYELDFFRTVITRGSVAEDSKTRFLNHFYDPRDSLGMPLNSWTPLISIIEGEPEIEGQRASSTRYKSALDWGRDEMPDDMDWKGALDAYDYGDTGRRTAYEALGHVLHLVQDMAQPDHATNRPHPGNYLKDKGFPTVKLGFEALWREHGTWPAGTTPKRVTSIEGAFNDMARASQAAESARGLPMDDEIASGLGPFSIEPPGLRKLKEAALRWAIRDNLWAKYEIRAPLVPTINYPNNQDERTRKYLDLGNEVLPLAEEYGAGLLIFFHDIVNPPPYVESVEIVQGGGTKYTKSWTDQTGDNRVTARTAGQEGGALEAGEQAQVRIVFGPWQREPSATGNYTDNSPKVREPVRDVQVWVVPGGSSGQSCEREGAIRVDGALSGGQDDSRGTSTWTGSFTPQKSGTLCIEARDTNNHWKNRVHPGDVLDGNPASPARVASDAPYEWTGYEPGPDLNHSFTVAEEPGTGCTASYTPEQLEKMRWATLTGTWTRKIDGKDFDVAFGGHGKFWTTSSSEESLTVQFRALDKSYYPLAFDNTEPPQGLELGHARGSYTIKGVVDIKYVDGFEEHQDIDDRSDAGVQGYIDVARSRPDEGGPQYSITLMEGTADDMSALANLHGPACPGEPLEGSETREQGNRNDIFWGLTVQEWSFTLTPTDPPEHIKLLRSTFTAGYPDVGSWASSYERRVTDQLQPAVTELVNRQKFAEAMQLQDALKDSREYLYDQGLAAVEERMSDITKADADLSDLWISNDAGADARYSQRLGELRTAISRWQEAKRAIEERYAAETEEAATQVSQVKPDLAEDLRKLAGDLRAKGFELVR